MQDGSADAERAASVVAHSERCIQHLSSLYLSLRDAAQRGDFREMCRVRRMLRRHKLQLKVYLSRPSHACFAGGGPAVAGEACGTLQDSPVVDESGGREGDPPPTVGWFYPTSAVAAPAKDLRTWTRYPLRLSAAKLGLIWQQWAAEQLAAQQEGGEGSALRGEALQQQADRWAAWLADAVEAPPPSDPEGKTRKPPPKKSIRPTACTTPALHALTDALDDLAFTTLQCLGEEERALRAKQSLNFKARQRYVLGFHEVLQWLKAGRLQVVLLASDLELEDEAWLAAQQEALMERPQVKSKKTTFRSLREAVETIRSRCCGSESTTEERASLPLCITCLTRHGMGYALRRRGCLVGCMGIARAEQYHSLVKALRAYGEVLTKLNTSFTGA